MKNNIKKLFFTFNSFQFFFSLLLWVPIFYEYQKRIGLDDAQIFRIQSLYYLIFCLLEIPTGYLADWLGYRLCLILGSITLIVANIWVPMVPTYHGFLTHFILIALARSFVSGASSAYLYETLHQENKLEEYKEAEGKARAYSLIGRVFCWAVIGFIMQWHLTLPYWLTALNASIGLVFAFLLPDTKVTSTKKRISILELFKVLKQNPFLLLLMLQGVSLFVLTRICQVNLFQPILKSKGFSVVSFGMMMSLMTVFEALGSFKSKWVKSYISDLYAIFIFTFLIGISFYLLSLSSFFGLDIKIVTTVALCFFSYIVGISFPIQRQLINHAISEPRLRASLLSSESIIDRGVNSLVANSLGAALAAGNLLLFLKQSAVVSIISVFIIALLIKFVGIKKNESQFT
jgi:MFS family permease